MCTRPGSRGTAATESRSRKLDLRHPDTAARLLTTEDPTGCVPEGPRRHGCRWRPAVDLSRPGPTPNTRTPTAPPHVAPRPRPRTWVGRRCAPRRETRRVIRDLGGESDVPDKKDLRGRGWGRGRRPRGRPRSRARLRKTDRTHLRGSRVLLPGPPRRETPTSGRPPQDPSTHRTWTGPRLDGRSLDREGW